MRKIIMLDAGPPFEPKFEVCVNALGAYIALEYGNGISLSITTVSVAVTKKDLRRIIRSLKKAIGKT